MFSGLAAPPASSAEPTLPGRTGVAWSTGSGGGGGGGPGGAGAAVLGLAAAPNGRMLAGVCADGTGRLWFVPPPEEEDSSGQVCPGRSTPRPPAELPAARPVAASQRMEL